MSAPKPQPETVSKDLYHEMAKEIGAFDDIDTSSSEYLSTTNDVRDMKRMGKTQQFKRNFRRLSSICFVCVLTGTWEFLLLANSIALTDGGRAGLFWSYIWCAVGMTFVMASLAEMSSMAPTSGGQYHWVSEFAPLKYQRFLSYIAGWLAVFSWQTGTATSGTLIAGIIQGIVTLYNPNYDPPAYQTFLIAVANFLLTNVFNVYGARYLATIQNPVMILHVFLLITIITVFWTLAPHPPASILLTFENLGGWPSTGLALCVGQASALYVLQSGDCAAHISEEVKDAGLNVPRSMFWGMVLNTILGLCICVSYIFAIPDVNMALSDPTGFPFLYAFQQCLPRGGTLALTIGLLVFLIPSNIAANASAARQTFAFARDRGLPFSKWIGHVDERLNIPANAVWATMTVSILLNLIILGSTTAFNALLSLNVVALTSTYTVSISVILWRRIAFPKTLPHCYWSLGKYGPAVNAIAVIFCIFAVFFCFWPTTTGFDTQTFNWSSVMFTGAAVLCMVLYFVRARRVYTGPVVTVEGYEAEARLEGFSPPERRRD